MGHVIHHLPPLMPHIAQLQASVYSYRDSYEPLINYSTYRPPIYPTYPPLTFNTNPPVPISKSEERIYFGTCVIAIGVVSAALIELIIMSFNLAPEHKTKITFAGATAVTILFYANPLIGAVACGILFLLVITIGRPPNSTSITDRYSGSSVSSRPHRNTLAFRPTTPLHLDILQRHNRSLLQDKRWVEKQCRLWEDMIKTLYKIKPFKPSPKPLRFSTWHTPLAFRLDRQRTLLVDPEFLSYVFHRASPAQIIAWKTQLAQILKPAHLEKKADATIASFRCLPSSVELNALARVRKTDGQTAIIIRTATKIVGVIVNNDRFFLRVILIGFLREQPGRILEASLASKARG